MNHNTALFGFRPNALGSDCDSPTARIGLFHQAPDTRIEIS